MKKVALNYIYLSTNHAGGKDQVGLNLLRGFYENGDSKGMMVICYDYSVETIRNLAPDIQIFSIRAPRTHSEFFRLLFQIYINTIYVPWIIKKQKVDCLFHLTINNGFKRLPCKVILLPHDIKQISHRKIGNLKTPLYKYLLYKIIYNMDFKHANQIIAISDCDKQEICQYYAKYAAKVIRIYNPIRVLDFDKSKSLVAYPYILAINIQFVHKNVISLIKAYEKIQNLLEQKLVLVGNVPERVQFLKEYVKEHNLERKVIFTGFATEIEMNCWIKNADLYVNPTLFEGFGMTAVEAIWKKVPCLVSDISVNVETTKGQCEYYGPADNINVLADKILACLKKPIPLEKRTKASEIMKQEYDYHKISHEYIKCFEKIMEEN